MSAQHTPGRLTQSQNIVRDANGLGALADNPETARRLAACWNACEGLNTDKLERMPAPFAQMLNVGFMELWEQYTTAKDQRDELLESAKHMQAWITVFLNVFDLKKESVEVEVSNPKTGDSVTIKLKEQFDKASDAISKVTGEAA